MPVSIISVLFTCMVSMYNFCDGDRNGFVKNLITGFGSCSLTLGTSLVTACYTASGSLWETMGWRNFPELTILFFVPVTTIHAQDFRGVEGDRAVSRNTIPMILPKVSRFSMPIILLAWSIVIVALIDPPTWLAVSYIGFSMVVGFRFVFLRRVEDDMASYTLYNVHFPDSQSLAIRLILTFVD